ncbi:MAG TPA: UDP-N-acetylmuramoyl-L-alanine--D-glutamate ligase [Gemmatimonadales bacterium]
MFDTWRDSRREVAVIGLGRSGAAATRLLRAHRVPVYASDSAEGADLARTAEALRGAGATVDLGGHDLGRIAAGAAVVLSPGVPPEASPVVAAREAGVEVRAELDVGLEALPDVRYVAVTGTNGKTTTTALVAQLMGAAGLDAQAGGNIGTPLTEIALRDRPPGWLALECSSFQLHDCPRIAPAAGILTNLAPDHLDRYPTLDAYYRDKALFFRNAGPGSVWVTNADDPASQDMVEGVPGTRIRFSTGARAEGWYDRAAGLLRLGAEPLLERNALSLLGDHNVANALAAALAVRSAAGAPIPALASGLASFHPLPHRLEPVREVDGVLWINDSKATNIASTEVAVAAVERPFVLLLGGRHKGESYQRLVPRLERCRAVVAFGEAGPIVARDLAGAIEVARGGEFEDVIAKARALARPGDVVLLSPACSSYDMFTNYEERGARFRALVEGM